jgi:hypothetical protein
LDAELKDKILAAAELSADWVVKLG